MLMPAVIPSRSLLLNASREPLCLITVRRAVTLVRSGKAFVLESDGRELRSEREVIALPVVACLTKYVHVPYRAGSSPTRQTVLLRDEFSCGYCGRSASTVDHIVPRSRGGEHSWTNVVAACNPCNHKKADRLLAELGLTLRVQPHVPSTQLGMISGARYVDPAWSQYLNPAKAVSVAINV